MQFSNDFSKEIWQATYKYDQEQTVDETFERVATAISSVENEECRKKWEISFKELLQDMQFCPAGRILSNAGTNFYGTTLFNCYTGSVPKGNLDSIDGIIEVLRRQCQTLRSEGGWGLNFSWLRPRGSLIKSIGVESPGAVKYMELFNKTSDIITSGSGKEEGKSTKERKTKIRKGAMMGCLFCWHPDIEEFITAKRIQNKLDKFNVSICCTNEFMDKVDRVESTGVDEEWDLVYPDTTFGRYSDEWNGDIKLWISKGYPYKVWKTLSVKYLWELIMRSTYEYNDPGVLFNDRADYTHFDNFDVSIYEPNPCGEQFMPRGSVCDLGSLVLPRFFIDGKFDFNLLKQATRKAVRFLDNVNDYSRAPLPEYEYKAKNKRRIGLGSMGWGSLLYLMRIRFGSQKAENLKKQIMQAITYTAIDTSISLAEEKGKFTGCDNDRLYNHPYFDLIELPQAIRDRIKKHGLRNSSLFSLQPTGNTGIVINNMSGGCEPVFLHEWIRTVIVQTPPSHIKDRCPVYWEGQLAETDLFKWTKEGKEDILKGVDEYGVTWKIDRNRGLTKEVLCEDYAVHLLKEKGGWDSNADWAVTTNQLSVEDHIVDLRGWSKWIDSAISKTVNIPNDYSYEDFKKIYLEAYRTGTIKGITTYRAGTMATVLSAVSKQKIQKTNSPKRPKSLAAKVFYPSLKGQKYYVVCGMYENDVYEVFAGKLTDDIPHSIIDGEVVKVKKGHYRLLHNESIIIDNLIDHCDHSEEAICRLLSAGLRHGADVKFLKEQLSNCKGELYSFGKVVARILGKFIPDNTTTTELCPECNKELIFKEGCKSCSGVDGCGWSKC